MFNHLKSICDAMDARRWRLSVALFLAGKACCTEEASTMEHSLEHNFCAHLSDMATHLAPRVSWTGESMVGTITSQASHGEILVLKKTSATDIDFRYCYSISDDLGWRNT
jgi:hypothetical protein